MPPAITSSQSSQQQEIEAAWSRRYNAAAQRYEGLDPYSAEAVNAVIEGLLTWERLLPQRSTTADGRPQPANKWGLGAERCVLRAFHSHLVAIGQPLLAARIRSETADLMQTAESLDECCTQGSPDPHAENRLVATARIQTRALTKLLSAIKFESNGGAVPAPTRKRGHPRCQDPAKDRRLMEEWTLVRGKAGMTRKEFCELKGITFRAFIKAQDRARKQSDLNLVADELKAQAAGSVAQAAAS